MPDWYVPTDEPSMDVLAASYDIRIDEYNFIDGYFEQFPIMGETYADRYVIIKTDESGLHSQALLSLTSLIVYATDITAGTIQLSTLTETNTGTNATKIITPYTYRNKTPSIITEATTARTISISDKEDIILCTNASDVTITMPLETSEDLGDGFITHVVQYGAGAVTVVGEGAVVITHALSAETRKQYSMLSIMKIGADEFKVIGDQAG